MFTNQVFIRNTIRISTSYPARNTPIQKQKSFLNPFAINVDLTVWKPIDVTSNIKVREPAAHVIITGSPIHNSQYGSSHPCSTNSHTMRNISGTNKYINKAII